MSHHIARWLLALLALGLAGCSADGPESTLVGAVNTARIASADKEPHNWLTHGRTCSDSGAAHSRKLRLITLRSLVWRGRTGADGARSFRHPHRARWCDAPLRRRGVSCMPSMRRRRGQVALRSKSIAPTAARPVATSSTAAIYGARCLSAWTDACGARRRRAPSSGKH